MFWMWTFLLLEEEVGFKFANDEDWSSVKRELFASLLISQAIAIFQVGTEFVPDSKLKLNPTRTFPNVALLHMTCHRNEPLAFACHPQVPSYYFQVPFSVYLECPVVLMSWSSFCVHYTTINSNVLAQSSIWVANRMAKVNNMDEPDDEDGAGEHLLQVHLVDLLRLHSRRAPLVAPLSPPQKPASSSSSCSWSPFWPGGCLHAWP